jgi:hypothetical protein
MKKTQKLSLLFTLVMFFAGSTTSFSQTLKEFFSDKTIQLTYLGIDYTKNLVINDEGANIADITGRIYGAMNDLVIKEQNQSKNYDIRGAFGRKNAINIDITAVTANNQKIDPKSIMSSSKADFKRLKETDIKSCVAALPLEGKEGIGLVFIMEGMKKIVEQGYGALWITLIDMKTKEVLMTERDEHEAEGFGFRNYWVSVIRRTIMEIDWSKYKEWKRKYTR